MDSIVELGGRLFIHKPSAEERGITKNDIAEQIEFVNDDEVVELISQADSVITF
jgi:sulfur relay (sulfurtransferase) DsrF/TusC family protein